MIAYPFILVAAIIESFLLGSVPSGVVIGKVFYGKDPREGGSGSIGATNVNRVLGIKAAIATFACDVAKGALAVFIARLIATGGMVPVGWQFDLALIISAAAAILGHVYTPWLGFKGGKGIATGLGSLLVVVPLVALCALGAFLIVAFLTRMVSAGSIAAATVLPIFACLFHWGSVPIIVTAFVIAIAVDFAHRENIKRIAAGEEPRFSVNRTSRKEDDHDDE